GSSLAPRALAPWRDRPLRGSFLSFSAAVVAMVTELLRAGRTLADVRRAYCGRDICEHMFVRWSNLTVESEEQGRLPGYREAVVRRFDAPEALQTRFYEVRARSILNHVPEQSRMPFRWTINPYRGCTHACTYCA